MHTFWHIARFELRYHLRQPVFYLFYALIVAQGFLYGQHVISEEASGMLYANSPGLFFSVFSTVGVLLTAIACLLTGQSLLRDRTYRVGDYLYALPLDERLYFAGKLVGVLGTCLLLSTGVAVGLLLLPAWVATPSGPLPFLALLVSFFLLLLPNLLIVVSLAYTLTAFLQRMAGAYVALLVLVVGQVLFRLGEQTVLGNDLLLLLDPFGHVLIREALSQQTPAEQWAGTLPFPDLLLINRLLWLGLSGGLLVKSADRLTFQYWANREPNRVVRPTLFGNTPIDPSPATSQATYSLPVLHRQFTTRAQWQLVGQLIRRDFLSVVRQPAFVVVALLLIAAILGYATGLGNLTEKGQQLLPFTSRMTYIRLPLLLVIGLFLTVFSGELLHRERSSGMWPLVDATPQPGWVLLLAKYGAMLGVAALLTGTLLVTGLSVQLLNGQTPINWSLYAEDLLLDGLVRYAQLIALVFLIQTVIPNRLAGQLASATVVVLLLAFDQTGLNGSWLALYSSLPNSWAYSELTGYGNLSSVRWLYGAMWSVAALLFMLLASGLGQRGVVVPVRVISQRWQASLRPGYVVWLTAVTAGVMISQLYLRFPDNQPRPAVSTQIAVSYRQTTQTVSVANRPVTVRYQYVHDQNLHQLQAMVAQTLTLGNAWLGTFPEAELTIAEVPFYQPTSFASPTRIDLSERDGWLTDTSDPDDAGQVDITIARTLLRHWVSQQTAGNTFITQSLPDYLALRLVQNQRGNSWLVTELARLQHVIRSIQHNLPESGALPDLQKTKARTLRGPLSLTCVGEVWGHEPLCRQIGRFIQANGKADASSFDQALTKALPDSLTYLTTYLSEQPTFDFRIGKLGTYPDRISVHVRAHKVKNEQEGHATEQLLNDYVPVVLLNAEGQIVYRQLVITNTEGRTDKVDWLPFHPDAVAVAVDPLGAWPEQNKRDNQKQLARVN